MPLRLKESFKFCEGHGWGIAAALIESFHGSIEVTDTRAILHDAVFLISRQRVESVCRSERARNFSSEVTNVSLWTLAVAAMIRSAGSPWKSAGHV